MKGVICPATDEMRMMALVGVGVSVGEARSSEEDGGRAERKWERASWVVRIGCVRFVDREA